MKINKTITIFARWGLAFILVLSAIGFVEKKHQLRTSDRVEVRILNQNGNFFITEAEVVSLIAPTPQPIIGQQVTKKALNDMELRLKAHQYISGAQVYEDLKGTLIAEVVQSNPAARLLRAKDPGAYITLDGEILPLSDRYAARVPLISGAFTDKLVEGSVAPEDMVNFLNLLEYIQHHEFWRAQIAQLEITSVGQVTMFPQVGKQQIEFGDLRNIEDKFRRLDLFYKKILPQKGWNSYERVNVRYQDQIICE